MGATAILIIDGLIDSACLRVIRKAAEPTRRTVFVVTQPALNCGGGKYLYCISDE